MYQIKKEEAASLLEKMRLIRQASGEMIAFLEHLTKLQQEQPLKPVGYNPDAYLEKEESPTDEFDRVHQELWEGNTYTQYVDDF